MTGTEGDGLKKPKERPEELAVLRNKWLLFYIWEDKGKGA